MERTCNSEIILGLGHRILWFRILSGGFESVDDTAENLSSTGCTTDPFHILTTLITRPNSDHIVRSKPDRPIVPEIPRSSGLDCDDPVAEIKWGIEWESGEFRVAIGEDGVDHIGVLGIDDFFAGFCRGGNLKRAELSIVAENRVGLEELEEGNLAVSEGESKTIVVSIFGE